MPQPTPEQVEEQNDATERYYREQRAIDSAVQLTNLFADSFEEFTRFQLDAVKDELTERINDESENKHIVAVLRPLRNLVTARLKKF